MSDIGTGITVDSSDNIYIVGLTEDGIDGNTHLGDAGFDAYAVKYNSIGVRQ